MFPSRSRIIGLAGIWLLGCSGGDPTSRATLLGEWTTSNAPELAASTTTMRFSESGECFMSGPITNNSTPFTYKDESGKERIAQALGSGTWRQEGDKLTVHLTEAGRQEGDKLTVLTQGDFREVTITFRVVSQSERQLVLERVEPPLEQGDRRTLTLFRPEGRR
jgi:hypothetical protein